MPFIPRTELIEGQKKTMFKIRISESGREELNMLDFDIELHLTRIIEFVPKTDQIGLDHIYIMDKPKQLKKHSSNARGAYFKKGNKSSTYIELYLSNLFNHIKNPESFKLMIPIQNIGLAEVIFHEVGHHVEKIRSHGISKEKREKWAEKYGGNLLSKYLVANKDSINSCFKHLVNVAEEKGLSLEIIEQMKTGWERQIKSIIN
jgi:hypothetical protein